MQYQGGKARLASKFAPIIDECLTNCRTLVEPFVGGFNVIPRLAPRTGESLCSDIHPGVITMWTAVQGGWEPPLSLSREEYAALRAAKDWSNPLTTFAAFAMSFAGKEWGGYAAATKDRPNRDYCAEGRASVLAKRDAMRGVTFKCCPYWELAIPARSLVYCDPPYRGTTGYRTAKWKHDQFDAWCEELVRARGCAVLVSELRMPEHWRVLWTSDRKVTCGKGRPVREKLATVQTGESVFRLRW